MDKIGEHKDDEPDLDKQYPIITFSFGEERTLHLRYEGRLRSEAKLNGKRHKFSLEHGSMFGMYYPTNEHWYHSINSEPTKIRTRISVTFRKIKV